MFDIRHYEAGDFQFIQPRQVNSEMRNGPVMDMAMVKASYVETYTVDGEPAGLVGLYPMYDGVLHAWAIPSDSLRGYGRQVVRATRSLLSSYEDLLDVCQYRTSTPEYAEENIKWLRLIGFEIESAHKGMLTRGFDLLNFVRWTPKGRERYASCQHLNLK